MATIASLNVALTADSAKYRKELDRAAARGKKFSRYQQKQNNTLKKSFFGVKTAIAAVSTILGSLAGRKLFEVSAKFETLRVRLGVVTDSAAEAEKVFGNLSKLATTLPLSVDELVGSFVKLQTLGLDPSERSLVSYTNTAAAMGKSLDQLIEAVADAALGEFERLKEFGIKAKKQGDEVTFIFKGVETTIENSSENIQEYLRNIGETDFAGAATKQMETLSGKLSNLEVAFENFLVKFAAKSGFDSFMKDALDKITKYLEVSTKAMDNFADMLPNERIIALNEEFDKTKERLLYLEDRKVLGLQQDLDEIDELNLKLYNLRQQILNTQDDINLFEPIQKSFDKLETEYKSTQKKIEKSNKDFQKTFNGGWKTAFEEYQKDVGDAAKNGADLFKTSTEAMEDALYNFAKTGKLSFKDFANIIIDEILRMNARAATSKIMGGLQNLLPSGGPGFDLSNLTSGFSFDSISNSLSNFGTSISNWWSGFTFQTGGIVPGSYSQPVPVLAHGSEMILNPSQQSSLFNMLNGAGGSQTFNINVTGDVSRQTREEITRMIPEITYGVNVTNRERGGA